MAEETQVDKQDVDNSEETKSSESESSTTETQDTTDWKAEAETQKVRADKAENDRKAILGAKAKQEDVQNLLTDILARQESSDKSVAALMKAVAAGETDNLPDELQTIANESAKNRAATSFQSSYNSLYETMKEAVMDEEGNTILDLEKAPELESFRNDVTEAHKRGSLGEIAAAMTTLYKEVRKAEKVQIKERIETERTSTEEATKKKLKDAGYNDHDLGSGASGSNSNDGLSGVARIKAALEKEDRKN